MICNSSRAFLAALLVVSAFHGLMIVLGVTQSFANNVSLAPDRAFQIFAMRVVVDGALLFIGHRMLRSQGIASRLGYGSMGAAATGIGYAFAVSNNLLLPMPADGTQLTAAIMPMIVGVIAASLYAQFAGRDVPPEAYADAPVPQNAEHPLKAMSASSSMNMTSPRQTLTFDGPTRVRTSMLAILIASLVPACLFVVVALPFFALLSGVLAPQMRPGWDEKSILLALPAYFFFIVLVSTSLPSAIGVASAHVIARSLDRRSGRDYAMAGAAIGFLIALVGTFYVRPTILIPAATISGALSGAVYRRFAGLEPLPLPEAVLATDPAHLVSKDHPTRHRHIVITNG